MSPQDTVKKPRWFSVKDAAEYLEVGEPTLYRWMRDGKITYRKVGDSTRFLQEDLDSAVQIFPSQVDAGGVREKCPLCNHDDLVPGTARSTGVIYFQPEHTKFWTLKDSNVPVVARMCTRCGAVTHFGNTDKLAALRETQKHADEIGDADAPKTEKVHG